MKAQLDREEKKRKKKKSSWSTCVNATPLDNVVGIQLKIANPVSRIIKSETLPKKEKKKKNCSLSV
jgi:hypothetical protein